MLFLYQLTFTQNEGYSPFLETYILRLATFIKFQFLFLLSFSVELSFIIYVHSSEYTVSTPCFLSLVVKSIIKSFGPLI